MNENAALIVATLLVANLLGTAACLRLLYLTRRSIRKRLP